jgi:hypothetical protein
MLPAYIVFTGAPLEFFCEEVYNGLSSPSVLHLQTNSYLVRPPVANPPLMVSHHWSKIEN